MQSKDGSGSGTISGTQGCSQINVSRIGTANTDADDKTPKNRILLSLSNPAFPSHNSNTTYNYSQSDSNSQSNCNLQELSAMDRSVSEASKPLEDFHHKQRISLKQIPKEEEELIQPSSLNLKEDELVTKRPRCML